jgi:hypothetical protein
MRPNLVVPKKPNARSILYAAACLVVGSCGDDGGGGSAPPVVVNPPPPPAALIGLAEDGLLITRNAADTWPFYQFNGVWDVDYSVGTPGFLVANISNYRFLNGDGEGVQAGWSAGTFCIYHSGQGNLVWAGLYASDDRGRTWQKRFDGELNPFSRFNAPFERVTGKCGTSVLDSGRARRDRCRFPPLSRWRPDMGAGFRFRQGR